MSTLDVALLACLAKVALTVAIMGGYFVVEEIVAGASARRATKAVIAAAARREQTERSFRRALTEPTKIQPATTSPANDNAR